MHAPRGDLPDPVAGDEELATGHPPDQPGDGRVAARAETDDDVLDAPQGLPGAVDEPAAGDLGEPEAGDRRQRRLRV